VSQDIQRAVIDFLASPATHGGAAVERIDTHSAIVFLAGARALKLKRGVRFDYLDFSTAALRHDACVREVEINRRAAPGIYRGVVAVTRDPGGALAFDGAGEPIDWCVDMVRFDQEALLDRVAARGALTVEIAERLAVSVARFHESAERRPDQGGASGLRWVIDGNALGFAGPGRDILPTATATALTAAAFAELERQAPLLDRRRAAGSVRQCHGDLHLRNIVLLEGQPTPFDAVEFNDAIACGDVLYDLAFLVMDLWRRGLRPHANVLLTRYLAETLDHESLALMPLFLSCRAAVRAKTSATAAGLQTQADERLALESLAREYLSMSAAFLEPAGPVLLAIGGRSGTGKSTLARALAMDMGGAPGAIVLRSDEIRKGLAGVPSTDRLEPGGYAPQITARVYDTMTETAGRILQAGHAVIADATFLRAAERIAIENAARAAAVPFLGLWLEAPLDTLLARVAGRVSDASDADAGVVREQMRQEPGPMTWHRLDASTSLPDVLEAARRLAVRSRHA
jgi:aminoglycoside phosphotransferase family enzyme/predicted kinase